MKFRSMLLSGSLVVLSLSHIGCASLVNGTSQEVSLETWNGETEVEEAECVVRSEKGRQHVLTPALMKLRRSGDDVKVECYKSDLPEGSAIVESSYSGWLLGNVLLGGLIGLGIDALTGAGHNYPETITVQMGEKVVATKDRVYTVSEEKS